MAQYATSDGALGDSWTGPEVVLIGSEAETNNYESNFRNLLQLDIRNVASGNALEYYNGADSQANAAKDMSQTWIYQHGYPGPYPEPGSQIAILDGASNNFAAGAMQDAGYRPGDTIAAIVYDGYVWTTPDFEVTLTPSAGDGIMQLPQLPTDEGSAVAYTVAIAKAGPQPWFGAVDFNLTFDFSNTPLPPGTQMKLGTNLLTPGAPYSVTGVTQLGWNGTLRIWKTDAYTYTITQGGYLSGLNLIADSSLGSTRGTSSNFGFGPLLGNDYSARTNSGRLVVRQGDSASANLITYGAGALLQGCRADVQAEIRLGGAPLPWSTYFLPQAAQVRIRQATDQSLNFALNAHASAPVGSGYTLRLTVVSPCGTTAIAPRSVDIPLAILPPAPNATPDRFVFVQGYAVFRISRVDANDVWGYAISQLYPDYNDITVGLQPRLVPWN